MAREEIDQFETIAGQKKFVVYTDGASRYNNVKDVPSVAGCAYIVYNANGRVIHSTIHTLGDVTSNESEYYGVLYALEYLWNNGMFDKQITLRSDSQIVVNQLDGTYRCKDNKLKKLRDEIKDLLSKFNNVKIEKIPREINDADRILRKELDDAKQRDFQQT